MPNPPSSTKNEFTNFTVQKVFKVIVVHVPVMSY